MAEPSRRLKWFERKARRAYWSVHIAAWLKSGVSLTRYTHDLRLNRRSMMRWLRVFEAPPPASRRPQQKPKKVQYTRMPTIRNTAFTAFWLMHIEALSGSGLTASEYAWAHHLPVRRFRKLRRQFRLTPPTQGWRVLPHQRVPPRGRLAPELRDELRHGDGPLAPGPVPLPTGSATGAQRRQYTDAQKLAIVAEAAESGVTVSAIARRHGVTPAMVFRWRTEFGFAPTPEPALLVTARVVERPTRGRPKRGPLVLPDLLPMPAGAITVELADGRRVYAPAGSDPEHVRQYVAQQESRR
jgi:transposase-like protein